MPLLREGEERWCLRVAWDGSAYVGWQRQPNGRSIQSTVEEALERLSGGRRLASASGRTDAGVHARAQVVSVDLPSGWKPARVMGGLNHHLPRDIVCLSAERAPDAFDPRRWVDRKRYRYRVLARRPRCPFRDGHTWLVRFPLDVESMSAAAGSLPGRHDFSAFRARGCSAAHPVRTLNSAEVLRADEELHLDFVGNGFLRHQVRIMVGTLVEVGAGRMPASTGSELLSRGDRAEAGPTAPSQGLWLMEVELADGPKRAKTEGGPVSTPSTTSPEGRGVET